MSNLRISVKDAENLSRGNLGIGYDVANALRDRWADVLISVDSADVIAVSGSVTLYIPHQGSEDDIDPYIDGTYNIVVEVMAAEVSISLRGLNLPQHGSFSEMRFTIVRGKDLERDVWMAIRAVEDILRLKGEGK